MPTDRRGRSLWLIMLVLLVVLAGVYIVASLQRSGGRANLVLIVVDTLRADHLSCYGYEGIRTRHIDELAGRGVLVRNAVTHSPITFPALATIMTSTLPPTSGVHYNEGFFLESSALTLAEVLSGEGYSTGGVVGAIVLDSRTGIAQGFGQYDDDFPEFKGYQPIIKVLESQFSHTQRRAEEVTDRALELATSMSGEEPFFLFAHYFDPHFPKDPPPPYSDIVDPLLKIGSTERLIQLYDGEIAYTDEHIGRLIAGLEEQGLLENTLVVFTGDHGEGLSEHDELTHSYFVYDQTIRIPLLFSMPGKVPVGMVYEGLAGHVDIVPTALDIIGVKWRGRYNLQGESLIPFERERGDTPYYFESAGPFVLFGWSGLRGVRTLDWKYIQAPKGELYRMSEDPGETENLIGEMPELADSLREEMKRILAGIEIHQGEGSEEVTSTEEDLEADRDFQEKLRALGYIGTSREFDSEYEDMFDSSLPDPKDKLPDFYQANLSINSVHMGVAALDQDSLEAAEKHFASAIDLNPDNTEAHFYIGLTYSRMDRYEDARRELDKTLAAEPDHVRARLALVDILVVEGDSVEAARELESIFSGDIDSEKELLIAGRLWRGLGRMDRFVEAMERLMELDPSNVPAQLLLGEQYLVAGDYDAACSYLVPLEDWKPESDSLGLRVYYALGRCRYGLGDLDGAEKSFNRMIDIDSTVADGYNQLGLISDDRGEYEKAVNYYERALSRDPSSHEIHSNLGVSYYKMGRYAESLEEFEAYLRHVEDEEEAGKLRAFIEHIREMERTQDDPSSKTP